MFNLIINVTSKSVSGNFEMLDTSGAVSKIVESINVGQLAGDLSTALHYMVKGEVAIFNCLNGVGDMIQVSKY